MKKTNKVIIVMALMIFTHPQAFSLSARHHLINMGKSFIECAGSIPYGILVQGPNNVKKAYEYEVWQREKEEKRGLLRYKLFALWRAPGEEMKGIIDGIIDSVEAGGKFLKNFISIFFSD